MWNEILLSLDNGAAVQYLSSYLRRSSSATRHWSKKETASMTARQLQKEYSRDHVRLEREWVRRVFPLTGNLFQPSYVHDESGLAFPCDHAVVYDHNDWKSEGSRLLFSISSSPVRGVWQRLCWCTATIQKCFGKRGCSKVNPRVGNNFIQ
jgi:hypothetical protein